MSRVLRNYDYLQPDMGRLQSGQSGQLSNEKLMNFVNYFVEIMFTIPPRDQERRMGWWRGGACCLILISLTHRDTNPANLHQHGL